MQYNRCGMAFSLTLYTINISVPVVGVGKSQQYQNDNRKQVSHGDLSLSTKLITK